MKDKLYTIFFSLVLGIICSSLLAFMSSYTAPYREENEKAEMALNFLEALEINIGSDTSSKNILQTFEKNIQERKIGDFTLYELISDDGAQDQQHAAAISITGPGLWGQVYGVIALESDLITIRGIRFYKHEETPGLGGEISADWFQNQFKNKKIVSKDNVPGFTIVKKGMQTDENSVDGITGATMTSDNIQKIIDTFAKNFRKELDGMESKAGLPAKQMKISTIMKTGIILENPIIVQVLGICSSLAVTNRLANALVMGGALIFVTGLSNLMLSAIRSAIPRKIRMIAEVAVIATFVIVFDLFLKAFFFSMSKQLGPYVGLIITNCIVMGRAEAFAIQNKPVPSFFDGIANGIGYAVILALIAIFREIVGSGSILGVTVLSPAWYNQNLIFVLAPGAFFTSGFLMWTINQIRASGKKKESSK